DSLRAKVIDGKIEEAIAVEVSRHDGIGIIADRVASRGLEGAIALAQPDGRRYRASNARGDVGDTVTVEVSDHQGGDRTHAGVALSGLEGAVALAPEDLQAGIHAAEVAKVAHGEIEVAVAVEVPRCHAGRIGADGIALARPKGTLTISEQD